VQISQTNITLANHLRLQALQTKNISIIWIHDLPLQHNQDESRQNDLGAPYLPDLVILMMSLSETAPDLSLDYVLGWNVYS